MRCREVTRIEHLIPGSSSQGLVVAVAAAAVAVVVVATVVETADKTRGPDILSSLPHCPSSLMTYLACPAIHT